MSRSDNPIEKRMQKLFPALSVRKQASRPAASLLVALVALVGAAWLPTPAQAAPAPEQFFNGIALPPPAGVYVSPALWHAAFANGIVIRDVSHQKFTQSLPLPPLGCVWPCGSRPCGFAPPAFLLH